jgi:hypothetical protein
MLTEDQLADQLRTRLRHEVATIEPRTDLLAALRRRQARRSLALRAGIAAVPVTATVAAVAVIVATAGGSAPPPPSTVLTAAMIQRVASASRLALAQSGQAKITYRQTQNGALQVSGTHSIAFAGKDWNDAFSQTLPAADGRPASTQFAINRIVNGQLYLYIKGRTGQLGWYRDTNPSGHPSMKIPDPRTLLAVLEPSARFEVTGHQLIGGVWFKELRVTNPPRLPALTWLPDVTPGAHLTQVKVWVDLHNVVHRMRLQVQQTRTVPPIYLKKLLDGTLVVLAPNRAYLKEARASYRKLRAWQHVIFRVDPNLPATVHHEVQVTSVSVTFTRIGVPQVITAPRHAVAYYGRG